jgi:hypothetical protein
MIEALDTEPTVRAMLRHIDILLVYYMTQVAIEMRSIYRWFQLESSLTLESSLYLDNFKNVHLYLWEVDLGLMSR